MMLQLSTAERCCCNFNCKANTGKAAERHAVAAKAASNHVSCMFATKCPLQPPAAAKGFKLAPAPNCL